MRRRRRPSTAIVEMTPLIDVVFLLVVFFLVAADATRLARPQVDLVPGPGEAPLGPEWDMVLTLDASGVWRRSTGGVPVEPTAMQIDGAESVLLRVDAAAPGTALGEMTQALRLAGVEAVDLSLGPEVDR